MFRLHYSHSLQPSSVVASFCVVVGAGSILGAGLFSVVILLGDVCARGGLTETATCSCLGSVFSTEIISC